MKFVYVLSWNIRNHVYYTQIDELFIMLYTIKSRTYDYGTLPTFAYDTKVYYMAHK